MLLTYRIEAERVSQVESKGVEAGKSHPSLRQRAQTPTPVHKLIGNIWGKKKSFRFPQESFI